MEAPGTTEVLTQALVFLAGAALVIPLVRRARMSAVMGFLLIGVAMGPHVMGRLASAWPALSPFALQAEGPTQLLAQMGLVFLLFIIGLEVSFERLWALRRLVLGLGLAQVAVTAGVIGLVALALGASFPVAAVLGLAFALSSTALVLQLLRERRNITGPVGRTAFSVLLTQDLMVVPILFVVAALSPRATVFGADQVGAALATALVSLALILLAGRLVLRPLFRWGAGAGREVLIAAALLAAIGMAVAADAAGFSLALGALLAGLLLAGTEFRLQIETDLEPFKDLLLGLFFVTVGMQIDVPLLLREPLVVIAGVALLFLVKAAIVAPLARAFGLSWPRALETAFLLGQVGEFAFVIVAAARAGGVIPPEIAVYMLLITAISIFVAPLTATMGSVLARRITAAAEPAPPPEAARQSGHIVIAGFGRVGHTLADMLRAQEIAFAAIECDPAAVAPLHGKGMPVYFGDASRSDVLAAVGAANAAAIVVTMDKPDAVERIVAEAKRSWPHIPVYARARDAAHARRLHAAGAALASPDTVEAALQLGEALLQGVGVPDEVARRIVDQRRDDEVARALYRG